MSLLSQKFLSNQMETNFALISFFYIFSMYSVNNFLDQNTLKASKSYKYKIYKKFGKPLLILSVFFTGISIYLSLNYSKIITTVLVLFYVIGFLYSTSFTKKSISMLNINFIKKTYNSKVVTSLGWVIVTVLLPTLYFKSSTDIFTSTAISLFIINHIFVRHNLMDIVAFQGDLILGRETLSIWFGPEKVKMISLITSSIIGCYFLLVIILFKKYSFLFLLFNLGYFVFILFYLKKMKNLISLKYELIVDANYVLLFIFYLLIMRIG